ncbi:uncharacterized protein [Pseudorasbora parva]|uniref:uncharacterized protein n=1 Tax=Pseudorasbora parva TaxID=51549 RepID=UPI00351DE918
MGGVPMKSIPIGANEWYDLDARDRIAKLKEVQVGHDQGGFNKGLGKFCDKVENAARSLPPSIPTDSYQEVQVTPTQGSAPLPDNREEGPHEKARPILNSQVEIPPPCNPEVLSAQAKSKLTTEVKNIRLSSVEAYKPRKTVFATPIRHSEWDDQNTEMGAGREYGSLTRLTPAEKNSLLAEIEPFKLYSPNKVLWDKIEAIARQQNLGIADIQALVEGLIPTSKLKAVQTIRPHPFVPSDWTEYCEAYTSYKYEVEELLGQGSYPWTSVTQVKQRVGESPLEYADRFRIAYETNCAVNCKPEDCDCFIVLESATGSLNVLPLSQSGHHCKQRCAVTDVDKETETQPEWKFLISKFPDVWAKDTFDCELAQVQSLSIPGPMHVAKRQYPLRNEAREGAKSVVDKLCKQGIIIPCTSPTNSPIWSVKKSDNSWGLTTDFTALNAASEKMHPLVMNPSMILYEIGSEHCYFTALDISNTFWTCPLAKEDPGKFAFTCRGRQWAWCRLPQGFCNSPTLFHQVLASFIDPVRKTVENDGSFVLKYVDDILIASPSKFKHLTAVRTVLNALKDGEFKANLKKAQLALPEVTYLGQIVGVHDRRITPERVKAIVKLPKPNMVTGLRQVMDLLNYCRQYVPEYTELSKPLTESLKGGKPGSDLIDWTEEMEEVFVSINETLTSSPALRHADSSQPFHLWTWVGTRSYSAALGQRVPGRNSYGMVGYYSVPIPVSMAGQHPCLLTCDCAEWAVETTEDIVTHQKVILHTRHQILKLLTNTCLSSILNQRRVKGETTLLSKNVEIQIDNENAVNPASLLPEEGTAHNCVNLIENDSQSPLQAEPLSDAMNLFVDRSSFNEQGQRSTGWAVVNEHYETVECDSLSGGGAQVADLVTLTCKLQHGKAFGTVHDFGPVWKQRGFPTTPGLPISHQKQVLLPRSKLNPAEEDRRMLTLTNNLRSKLTKKHVVPLM